MKTLLLSAAALAVLAAAAPASADVFADWSLNKDKNVTITIDTNIDKDVATAVDFDEELTSQATSDPLINSNNDNHTVGAEEGIDDFDIQKSAIVDASLNANTGIGQLNQDTGNFANQGNVVAAAIILEGGDAAAGAQAYAEQLTRGNDVTYLEDAPTPEDPNLESTLTGSLNENIGVLMANQNSGNVNSQHNALSAAIASDAVLALADAGLRQVNSGNTVTEQNTVKRDLVVDSVLGNTGVVAFNQATGNMNQQATIVNVAALSSAVGL